MLAGAAFDYISENQRKEHHVRPSQEHLLQEQLHPAREKTCQPVIYN
jgi:hypothetical protein